MNIIDYISFIAFGLILVSFGIYKTNKVKSQEDYLLAGRNVGIIALTATLVMTEFNTATLISFSSLGFLYGMKALWLPFVFLVGLVFYSVTVAKKWKEFNGISVAEFFSKKYGQDVGIIATIIFFTTMVAFSATYVKSMTFIFAPLFTGYNEWLVSGLLVATTLLMIAKGGLVSIIRTDLVSFFAVIIFFPLLVWIAWVLPNSSPNLATNVLLTKELPAEFIFSLILLTMFSYILAPWYGQKIFSAKNVKIAYLAVAITSLVVFFLYEVGVIACALLESKGIVLNDPQTALPYLINLLPSGIKGIAYAILFAIAATTLAGMWSAMVTILIGKTNKRKHTEGIRSSLLITLICALLSYITANSYIDKILDKMILTNIPIVALSYTLLAGFYWSKSSKLGAYFSIITGFTVGIGAYIIYGEEGIYTWYWSVYGIPAIFITGVIGSYLFPDNKAIL